MNQHEATPAAGVDYALGHDEHELDRLKTQARLIDPVTRAFFGEAGIVPGMRVLDVGCGAGDTSLLFAEMVGEGGEVVGADRAPAAIAAARARAGERRNLTFLQGDPSEMIFEQRFDAVVGRYVLMFQEHPAAMLRALASHVRPGGLIAFHELTYEGISTSPPLLIFDQVWRWNAQTTRLYGANPSMGAKLYAAFVTAGLAPPTLRAEALWGRGSASADVLLRTRNLTRSLVPEMVRLGVATREEVGLESLLERMHGEAMAMGSVVVGPFGGWRVESRLDRSRMAQCPLRVMLESQNLYLPSGVRRCSCDQSGCLIEVVGFQVAPSTDLVFGTSAMLWWLSQEHGCGHW